MPRSLSPSPSRDPRTDDSGGGGDGSHGHDDGGGGGGDGGEPVKVAYAQNQTEAEMIQGLLTEHGIPSMLKRARGFDVPDFLAVGPRDVFVPAGLATLAREVLEGTPGAR